MVSFLKKLRGEGVGKRALKKKARGDNDDFGGDSRKLDLDVFLTTKEIVIYAPIYGARIDDVDVAVQGDNDIITIKGHRMRPESVVFKGQTGTPEGKFYAEEMKWGDFYRQIILPEEIDIKHTEAKLKNGILMLVLPLMRKSHVESKKMKIVELKEK